MRDRENMLYSTQQKNTLGIKPTKENLLTECFSPKTV